MKHARETHEKKSRGEWRLVKEKKTTTSSRGIEAEYRIDGVCVCVYVRKVLEIIISRSSWCLSEEKPLENLCLIFSWGGGGSGARFIQPRLS